jgi:hypothetical protein
VPDGRIRHAIYKTFAEGGIPLSATLSHQLHVPVETVRAAMERLHESHAIVLDPSTREVWMALPFSSVPTPFVVNAAIGDRSWFANCAWDAFGIPNLLDIDAVIATACQDCGGPIVYRIEERRLADAHGVVHFGVPASKWWDDIGFT